MFAGEDFFAEANGPADNIEQSVMIAVLPVTGIQALIEAHDNSKTSVGGHNSPSSKGSIMPTSVYLRIP